MRKVQTKKLTCVALCLTQFYTQIEMSTPPETTLTIRLPRGLKNKLKALAKQNDLTVSQLIRKHLSESVVVTKEAA